MDNLICTAGGIPGFCGGVQLYFFRKDRTSTGNADIKDLIRAANRWCKERHTGWGMFTCYDREDGYLQEAFAYADKHSTIRYGRKKLALCITPPTLNPNSGHICRCLTVTKIGE